MGAGRGFARASSRPAAGRRRQLNGVIDDGEALVDAGDLEQAADHAVAAGDAETHTVLARAEFGGEQHAHPRRVEEVELAQIGDDDAGPSNAAASDAAASASDAMSRSPLNVTIVAPGRRSVRASKVIAA